MNKLLLIAFLGLLGGALPARNLPAKGIYLDSLGIHYAGHTLQMGQDSSVWIAALGQPSRRLPSGIWKTDIRYLVWDALGVAVAYYGYRNSLPSVRYAYFYLLPVRRITRTHACAIDHVRHMGYFPNRFPKHKEAKFLARYGATRFEMMKYQADPRHYTYTSRAQRHLYLNGMRVQHRNQVADLQANQIAKGQAPFSFWGYDCHLPGAREAQASDLPRPDSSGYYRTRYLPKGSAGNVWVYVSISGTGRVYYVGLRADNA
jgi:hypothetical protein